MKSIFTAFFFVLSFASQASSTVKQADLACKWEAFNNKTMKFDDRKFNLTLQLSESGEGMVFKDSLKKMGLKSLEVQAIPQGEVFTMTSSVSMNFVIRDQDNLVYQGATSSTLQKGNMNVLIQVGEFSSELNCTVGNVTKL
jgi:hypothetical protein